MKALISENHFDFSLSVFLEKRFHALGRLKSSRRRYFLLLIDNLERQPLSLCTLLIYCNNLDMLYIICIIVNIDVLLIDNLEKCTLLV